MTEKAICPDCRHSYSGADGVLRCRPSRSGVVCDEVRERFCTIYEREPEPIGVEAGRVWFDFCPTKGSSK